MLFVYWYVLLYLLSEYPYYVQPLRTCGAIILSFVFFSQNAFHSKPISDILILCDFSLQELYIHLRFENISKSTEGLL